MNTFILSPHIPTSATFLDKSRLHKQAVEIKQIILALEGGPGSAWYSHPAVQQWREYKQVVLSYGLACFRHWKAYGYSSTLEPFFSSRIHHKQFDFPPEFRQLIPWHRKQLIHKVPSYYAALFGPQTAITHATYIDPDNNYRLFRIERGFKYYLT